MQTNVKIQKFQKWNSFIELCPERWWLITQININWKDFLYLNKETFFDLEKNVRWWIPIMFPQAWPILENKKNNKIKNIKQHWFARNSVFEYEINQNNFKMFLKSDDETKKLFDYDFNLEIIWEIFENWIKVTKKIKNTWNENMPVSPWFHPYFLVENNKKDKLNIFLENYWKINDFSFCNWETVVLWNIWNIKLEWLLNLEFSKNYNNIWIRSEPWKDFLCIEPVYKNENAIIDEPLILKSWEEVEFFMIVKRDKN